MVKFNINSGMAYTHSLLLVDKLETLDTSGWLKKSFEAEKALQWLWNGFLKIYWWLLVNFTSCAYANMC